MPNIYKILFKNKYFYKIKGIIQKLNAKKIFFKKHLFKKYLQNPQPKP